MFRETRRNSRSLSLVTVLDTHLLTYHRYLSSTDRIRVDLGVGLLHHAPIDSNSPNSWRPLKSTCLSSYILVESFFKLNRKIRFGFAYANVVLARVGHPAPESGGSIYALEEWELAEDVEYQSAFRARPVVAEDKPGAILFLKIKAEAAPLILSFGR